jgi:Alw26I/Eco31I/Esp3I family type II restriction m6 adenine DNA methyltransferase
MIKKFLLHEEKLIQNNSFEIVHGNLILSLIHTYLSSKGFGEETLRDNIECNGDIYIDIDIDIIKDIKIQDIPIICEELHINFLNSKFENKGGKLTRVKSKNNLIEKGAVYTGQNIAREMVENTISNYIQYHSNLIDIKVLDFGCGTGRFYENIIDILHSKYSIATDDIILKNVFAIDVDSTAVNITRLKAISLLTNINEENIKQVSKNILLRNGLIHDVNLDSNILKESDLYGLHDEKFDIVISNPPYLVLKINKGKGQSELSNKIQKEITYFRNSNHYEYSIEGMLNYYRLSIEAILSMVKPNGEIGIICPSSLFADISATKLRKHILLNHKLRSIKYFAEKEHLFGNDVTQATNIFYLQKSGITNTIEIEETKNRYSIELSLVEQLFPNKMEIPFITEMEWKILKKISTNKKLKEVSGIRNRRGELDLTLYKNYITTEKTPFRLVRGNMISETGIKNINGEYVTENFIDVKSSGFIENDFKKERLVCQQISNAGLKKRLVFVFCDKMDILGNSCNYISGDEKTLSKLNFILNSSLLNWRFKITSTNNHINNYELDELPIVDLDLIDEYRYQTQRDWDRYIAKAYGLSEAEMEIISND